MTDTTTLKTSLADLARRIEALEQSEKGDPLPAFHETFVTQQIIQVRGSETNGTTAFVKDVLVPHLKAQQVLFAPPNDRWSAPALDVYNAYVSACRRYGYDDVHTSTDTSWVDFAALLAPDERDTGRRCVVVDTRFTRAASVADLVQRTISTHAHITWIFVTPEDETLPSFVHYKDARNDSVRFRGTQHLFITMSQTQGHDACHVQVWDPADGRPDKAASTCYAWDTSYRAFKSDADARALMI